MLHAVLHPFSCRRQLPVANSGVINSQCLSTSFRLVPHPVSQIMEALSRQGLQNTDYGRKVIAMAAPATNTRRDNMTTEQRGAVR